MLYKNTLYICPVIADDVARSSISDVSLKQCSKRDLDYQGEKGLAFVSMFVILEKQWKLQRMSMQPK